MRLRFTIRDLLLAIAILTLAVGWWIDHRRMKGQLEQSRTAFLERALLNDRVYDVRRTRITALFESAETTTPTPEETAEVIETIRYDPDFRIKVRAMAILPYVHEREQAIDVLIEATKDRADDSSGGGNVPLYAGKYLAEMKASRAISAVEDWVTFVKQQHPYDAEASEMILKKSLKDLETLKACVKSTSR